MRAALAGRLLLAATGCHPPPAPPDAGRVVPVEAVPVERRDVPIFLDGLGTVTALKTITVRTQVDGRLEEVRFREGQEVRPGQLLARIDARPFIAQLHQAEGALMRDRALLRTASIILRRDQRLFGRHLIAQEDVDNQRAQVGQYLGATQIDQGQIEAARLNIRYARIVSPIHGVTGIRQVDPGNLVHVGDATGIVILTQLEPIAVLFTLPQDDLPAVAEAMRRGPLTVDFYSRDRQVLLGQGRLELVDNQINPTTATIRLKAIAPNPVRRLWPNQFVKAHLHLTTRRGAVVVPSSAVQRGPEGPLVWVVAADETVAARPVQVELTQGDLSILRAGLSPGERVVVEGQNQLSPGSRVLVRDRGAARDGGGGP